MARLFCCGSETIPKNLKRKQSSAINAFSQMFQTNRNQLYFFYHSFNFISKGIWYVLTHAEYFSLISFHIFFIIVSINYTFASNRHCQYIRIFATKQFLILQKSVDQSIRIHKPKQICALQLNLTQWNKMNKMYIAYSVFKLTEKKLKLLKFYGHLKTTFVTENIRLFYLFLFYR